MKIILILIAVVFISTLFFVYQECFGNVNIFSEYLSINQTSNFSIQKIFDNKKYIAANYTIPGRLGNILFRFASLYGIGKALNRRPYFNANNSLQIEALQAIADAFPFLSENIEIKVPNPRETKKVDFSDECCKYEDPKNLQKYDNIKYLIVGGNFLHSYKFFHSYQNDIKKLMECSEKLQNYANSVAKEIWKNDVKSHKFCIQVRRGDFADYPMFQETTMEFVIPATIYIYKKLKHQKINNISLTILNNDENFSRNLVFTDLNFTSINVLYKNSAEEDLCFASKFCDSLLMSASASTYAWWIGYLMEKQTNIYYNAKMAKNTEAEKMYFPDGLFLPNWQKLQQLENGTIIL